ncbi:MAG: NAD+ synthase, partial [Rhodospirillaceae bacterium]|nr:NAD+ synthase [Rhodospirillaceae bacterium]
MTEPIKITLAQLNPKVGDLEANLDAIRKARASAAGEAADLVVCGELGVSGYPPEDLVLKRSFQDACRASVEALAADTADGGPGLLISAPWVDDGVDGDALYNAAILLDDGKIQAVVA